MFYKVEILNDSAPFLLTIAKKQAIIIKKRYTPTDLGQWETLKMKLGIINTAFRYQGKTDYEYMRKVGYDATDFQGMMLSSGCYYTAPQDEMIEKLKDERKAANDAGITVNQVHSVWPVDDKTPLARIKSMELSKRAVLACEALGAKYLVCHPPMPDGYNITETDPEFTYKINKNFFTELSIFAAEHSVSVCIENMPFKKNALSYIPEILRLVSDVNLDNFGVCLDTGHANILGIQPADAALELGDKLFCLHIHDNTGWADQHRFPYCGTIGWERFKDALKAIGFAGCLSLETNFQKNIPKNLGDEMHRMLFSLLKTLK